MVLAAGFRRVWPQLRQEWSLDCTDQILRAVFARRGYFKCKACQKGIISLLNKARQREFCDENIHNAIEFGKRVIFSDECHFARNNHFVSPIVFYLFIR
jgi:hypothetical protein